jgi:hypothetical protein
VFKVHFSDEPLIFFGCKSAFFIRLKLRRMFFHGKIRRDTNMNQTFGKSPIAPLILGLCIIILLGIAVSAQAVEMVLTDSNSTVKIDPTSQTGMYQWIVDGANYADKQWFWYRTSSMSAEQSIDTLPYCTTSYNTPSEGVLTYTNSSDLKVQLTISLLGGSSGSNTADIMEGIRLYNLTGSSLTVSFFEYNHFKLSDNQDTVAFQGNNHVIQTGPVFNVAENFNEAESVVTGKPLHEAKLFPTTINTLNDSSITALGGDNTAGPGDVTWAFEWDLNIAPHGTAIISKDKILYVPEPSSIMLLALFGFCLALARRYKRNAK